MDSDHLKEVERLLRELIRGEKAQLLQWVARDLGDAHPGIETNPSACGGAATMVRTRIPREEQRVVVTLDRRDFFRLHRQQAVHEGIIACTFDPDFAGQAKRIHEALAPERNLQGVVLRVNRPPG